MNQGILSIQHLLSSVVGQTNGPFPGRERSTSSESTVICRRIVSCVHAVIAFMTIVCGVLILSLVLPSSYYCKDIHRSAVGVWCGTIYLITAVTGACNMRNKVLNSLYLAVSMFSLLISAGGIIVAGFAVACITYEDGNEIYDYSTSFITPNWNDTYWFPYYQYRSRHYTILETKHHRIYYIILLCFNALAMLLSIIEASLTCSESGCCTQAPTLIYYNTGDIPSQQPINHPVTHTYSPPFNVQQDFVYTDPYYCEPKEPPAIQPIQVNNPHYELTIRNEA